MTVKFEGSKYQVGFYDMLEINYHKLILVLKRQKRRLKLLINGEELGQYLIVTGLWLIFGGTMLFSGRFLSGDGTSQYGIVDILWEYFASVIIVYAFSTVEHIRSYRSNIRSQHDIYVTAMSDFQKLIESFVPEDQNRYHALYCDKCLDDTLEFVKMRYPSHVKMNDTHRLNLTLIRDRLARVESEFMKGNIVRYHKNDYWLYDSFDEARVLVNKMLMSKLMSMKEMGELEKTLKHIVDCLREPWRVDVGRKIRILKLLAKEDDNEIKDDFYFSMLLYGHEFSSKTGITKVQVRRKG